MLYPLEALLCCFPVTSTALRVTHTRSKRFWKHNWICSELVVTSSTAPQRYSFEITFRWCLNLFLRNLKSTLAEERAYISLDAQAITTGCSWRLLKRQVHSRRVTSHWYRFVISLYPCFVLYLSCGAWIRLRAPCDNYISILSGLAIRKKMTRWYSYSKRCDIFWIMSQVVFLV